MALYNIYAGLGGSFGGATYHGSIECENEEIACQIAYEEAVEEYQSYEGYHGILEWGDVAEENNLDPDDPNNYQEIDELYNQEIESWIDYYAVLASKDKDLDEEIYYI